MHICFNLPPRRTTRVFLSSNQMARRGIRAFSDVAEFVVGKLETIGESSRAFSCPLKLEVPDNGGCSCNLIGSNGNGHHTTCSSRTHVGAKQHTWIHIAHSKMFLRTFASHFS
jgi:hypothetical protein